jgi:cell division septum initiation protein DivIVA
MDIVKALRELYLEKKRLDAAIADLEARIKAKHGAAAKSAKGRRGRKSMSAAERLAVSKRMTSYWEARRAQIHPPPAPPPSQDQQSSTTSAS